MLVDSVFIETAACVVIWTQRPWDIVAERYNNVDKVAKEMLIVEIVPENELPQRAEQNAVNFTGRGIQILDEKLRSESTDLATRFLGWVQVGQVNVDDPLQSFILNHSR